ncbi:MAG: LacI family DNA-binding transcriptional regulator, partial [Chloroflexi bacterium]|nr:LacI family DNA-binding transcriptional regulator [Chloroflexota bacterium]
ARELGYRASARARWLAAGESATARCGVVILGRSVEEFGRSLFFGKLFFGIVAQAETERMDLHVLTVPAGPVGRGETLARLVAEDRADGYILLSQGELGLEDALPLEKAGLPYVLASRHFDDRPVSCATIDHARATQSTAERLGRLGHRRMALLLPEGSSSTIRDHERGWRAGLARAGIDDSCAPVVRHLDVNGAYAPAARRAAVDLLARDGDRPTAIACFNDISASGVLAAAAELGLRVPDELSVIGFDNLVAPLTTPPLCSYECHVHEVGAAAAGLLGSALRGELGAPRHVTFVPDFVCRGTCGPASAAFVDAAAGG